MRNSPVRNKLLSAMLAVALILSLIPVTALAADPPILSSAQVTPDGGIELIFNKAMQAPADTLGYTILRSDGVPRTVTKAELAVDTTKIKLTLNSIIYGGEAFTISYGTGGTLQSAEGVLLGSFNYVQVTNGLPHPTITGDGPPAGTLGTAYNYTFTVDGGTGPYSFYVNSGSLPSGLVLDSSSGVLSGTPVTYSGTFTFKIHVIDTNYAQDTKQFSITINPAADTTPPAFEADYPRAGAPQAAGSRQVRVVIHMLEEAYYYLVLLPDRADRPSKEQVRNGQDASGGPALKSINSGSSKTDEIDTGTFGPLHDTDYDAYVVLCDDTGNISEPVKVDVRTPPAADFFVDGYPVAGASQPAGSKQVQVLVQVENTQTAGMVYYVLVPDGAAAPSIKQISEGKDSIGADALDAGTIECNNDAEYSFVVDGAADLAAYDLYLVAGDTYYSPPIITCTDVVCLDVTTPPADQTVNGIAIKTQPSDLEYAQGESLDLSGLVVTLTYISGSSEDVPFTEFAARGIAVSPVQGTTLIAADHHGLQVEVTHGVYSVSTNSLTVTAPQIGGGIWNYRSPLPSSNIINKIEYIDGKYMGVGYNGTLITSADGVNWNKIDVGTDTDRLNGIANGNGKYVIVGNADSSGYVARIFTSDDGLDWHETAAVPNHGLYDVVYGDGKFVAVGQAGKIVVSDDGENWNIITVDPMDYTLLSVTYANGNFVATGMRRHTGITQRGAIMTSEDGETWAVKHTHSTYTIWDVTHGEGVYAAVGGRSDQAGSHYICTSTDGETWTGRSVDGEPGYNSCFYSVGYDGSRFITVGATTGTGPYLAYIATSDDGTAWTYRGNSTIPAFNAVAADASGTRCVAMGGTGNIHTSDNGGTGWVRRTQGATKNLTDVAWNGSDLYVSVGVEGTIQTSPDGETWTICNSGTTNNLNKVDYLNSQFIAVGRNGTIVTSSNGTDWNVQTSGTSMELKGIAYGSGRYIVVGGDNYNSIVLASTGGIEWNTVTDTDFYSRSFVAVAYGNGDFLALTEYGHAFKSANGIDWVHATDIPGSGRYPTDMIYAGGKFAAVGGYGEIYLSSDNGASWTVVETDSLADGDSYLDTYSRSIAYGGGNFAAVGILGKIIASADGGTTWYIQPSGLYPNPYFSLNDDALLSGIVAGDGKFMTVGGNGVALQSESFSISTDADAHDVALTKLGSTFSNLYYSETANITRDIYLPETGVNDTSISWASSKPEYITDRGAVTRPSYSAGDQVVYLTATISKGSAVDTKTFIMIVKGLPNQDAQDVADAKAALTFDVIKGANTAENNIISNLSLMATGSSGTTIEWYSGTPAYIAINGNVTRPAQGIGDQVVNLRATIRKGGESDTKTFTLTVKALTGEITIPPAQPLRVAGGSGHSLFLKEDGTVWAWGANSSGQLGRGTTGLTYEVPAQVLGLADVKAIAAGQSFSLALKEDGTVWAWGTNGNGQLGPVPPLYEIQNTAVQVTGLSNIEAISAGYRFGLALDADGNVWAWGANLYGQLGKEAVEAVSTPERITGLSDIVAISAGYQHSLALDKYGRVWAWGSNGSGQLGNGTVAPGGHNKNPTLVSGLAGLTTTYIYAAYESSMLITDTGLVYGWGYNGYGQLGDGSTNGCSLPTLTNYSGFSALGGTGAFFTALKSDASVWASGNNSFGALGIGSTGDSNVPVQVKGLNGEGFLSGIVSVSQGNGGDHTLAMDSSGNVWAWGGNYSEQCGVATISGQPDRMRTPVKVEFPSQEPQLPIVIGVSINGTAVLVGTLTVNITYSSEPAGIPTLSFQWKRDGADITGATGSSYIPANEDVGKTISVTVTASGTATGTLTSAATAPVQDTGEPGTNVCEIVGGARYATLDSALAVVQSGQTIKLLTDIVDNDGIIIVSRSIVFDLNGHTLEVVNTGELSSGLRVINGGRVSISGEGSLNVSGELYGLDVRGAGSSAAVTKAAATGVGGTAAIAYDGGEITLKDAAAMGISSYGVEARNGTVNITGNVQADTTGSTGIFAERGGLVNMTGGGNIESSIDCIIASDEGSSIYIEGSVKAENGAGVKLLDGATAYIAGNIMSEYSSGVVALSSNGKATRVTVDGDIFADSYITVGINDTENIVKTKGDFDSSTPAEGYLAYSSGNSLVLVKAAAGIGPISDQTLTALNTGYASGTQETKTITVIMTGTGSLGNVSAALSGADADSFELTQPAAAVLDAVTPSTTFTVKAKDGLPAKTYTALVTVSADYTIPAVFSVTQEIAQPAAPVASAVLSPASAAFDKNPDNQADVNTSITWNDAHSVNDIKSAGISIGAANYTVAGNTLTIKQEYLALQPIGSLDLTVEFDRGNAVILTIVVQDTTAPHINTPPVWPAGSSLTASGTTKTATTLGWTPAQDDAGVTGYRIYRNGSLIQSLAGTVLSFEITGLSPATSYTFRIQAGDGNNQWTTDGPSVNVNTDSSGSSGSNTPTTPGQHITAKVIDSEGNSSETAVINLNESTGTAVINVNETSLSNAFNSSKADGEGVKTVEVIIPEIAGVKSYETTLPASTLNSGDVTRAVAIDTGLAKLTIPGSMLNGSDAAAAKNVTLTVAAGDKSRLAPEVQALIGDRPILELSLKLDGRQTSWSNENAPVTVTIPYTPSPQELANPESIIIWYIDGSGNAVSVPNGRYDPATGTVTFTTTHFSYFAIGYNKLSFKDVAANAWYGKAVAFIAAREITTGTGNGNYSPEAKLTRGQFIVMLMKAYSITPDTNPEDNFADAGNTWYSGYLAAAKRLGISAGVGNNLFAPEKEITRQEMFTLLYNTLKTVNKLPRGNSEKSLSGFSDAGDIASWAKDAVTLLVKAGTISGSDGKLAPTDTTTRAQMAQVLYNLLSK